MAEGRALGLPPKISRTLVRLTDEPRPEEALSIVLKDYLDEKVAEKEREVKRFEEKWGMEFQDFADRLEADELPEDRDPYSFEVEEDYREWEAALTLLEKYRSIRDDLD